MQASRMVLLQAQEDIQSGGVERFAVITESRTVQLSSGLLDVASNPTEFSNALEGVLSKLNVLFKCADEIAKVSRYV
jgi:hypothetical protein